MANTPTVLIVACDGSPAALHAADFVAAYRGEAARLKPCVVNVQPRPLTLWPGMTIDPAELDAALHENGLRELAPALERLSQAGLAPEPVVRQGFAAETLLEEARDRAAQAIVVGTRGHGALQGFAFGSVAMRVVHGGATPSFIIPPEARLPAQFGRRMRVLLATDGSENAARAGARLVAWRDWLGELEIHLVHVQAPITLLEAMLPPHRDALEHWSGAAAEKNLRAARDLLSGAGLLHQVHLVPGEPAAEIARLARETGSELVALGTRGHGAAHHALIGSIALKTAALSPVPLLMVP